MSVSTKALEPTGTDPRSPSRGGAETAVQAPAIELGWLVATELDPGQQRAVEEARDLVRAFLAESFPRFEWRLPVVVQPSETVGPLDEPVTRLLEGTQAREARGWDFALVVTSRDLRSYYHSFAFAVPSQSLATAVLSLARLSSSDATPHRGSAAPLARRIAALALHLFGDLNGLWHRENPGAVMRPPASATDLDRAFDLAFTAFDSAPDAAPDPAPDGAPGFSTEELADLADALGAVADLRLEEKEESPAPALFYSRASWERRREIASSVLQARPWELPLRLPRLTTAALSALLVLLLTAEVWDLGTSQSASAVIALSFLTLGGTSVFVLIRQGLLLRRSRPVPTEQTVVTHVSAALVVVIGFATTYLLLFVIAVVAGATLFGPELVGRWAPTVDSAEGWLRHLAVLAGLVSSVGLLIGALGASFEGNRYFLHVIYADEET